MKFNLKSRGCLFGSLGFLVIFIVLFSILYVVMEETWDLKGTGQITQVIDGNTLELESEGKKIRIELAFVDAPSPNSLHGQQAIAHIKQQVNTFKKSSYRVKKIGNQYVGEVMMSSLSWDLSLNHQLLLKGLARVKVPENTEWKELMVDGYNKDQSMAKEHQEGIWAYKGYVTKNGFDPEIEQEILLTKQTALQQAKRTKDLQNKKIQQENQAYLQSIQRALETIKKSNHHITSTHFKEDPEDRGKKSYILWVDVYVKEENWANMTTSQKLSFVVTTEKKAKDSFLHLPPFKQGGSTIVRFYSDTVKDQLAERKLIRLRGHKWRIIR